MSKWIPVEQLPPPNDKFVLVYFRKYGDGVFASGSYRDGNWYVTGWEKSTYKDVKVTHWRPLPKPPKWERT